MGKAISTHVQGRHGEAVADRWWALVTRSASRVMKKIDGQLLNLLFAARQRWECG